MPVLLPDVVIVAKQIGQAIHLGKPDIVVALLQGLMNHCPQEGFDAFNIPLNLVSVAELIL
jgi:hypothetical protein